MKTRFNKANYWDKTNMWMCATWYAAIGKCKYSGTSAYKCPPLLIFSQRIKICIGTQNIFNIRTNEQMNQTSAVGVSGMPKEAIFYECFQSAKAVSKESTHKSNVA